MRGALLAFVAVFVGEAGSGAIAKVMSLFLAAFGVSLIRRGMVGFAGH